MTYPILSAVFFISILLLIILLIGSVFRIPFLEKIRSFFFVWCFFYGIFILFFTGTEVSREQPKYKLPWKAGVSRFVAQGNRSFTSHRDFHEFAWDFVMPNGTEILAARDGRVLEVEESFDGIGLNSNFITIEHEDGERSTYAHIRHMGSLVRVGESVKQGQPIVLSGMVGETVFPHVHFYVHNGEGTASIPISFQDVVGGVPKAGQFYTSENQTQ